MSAVVYLQLCGFCLERFPLPLGAWDGLRYFIVPLPEPSYNYFITQLVKGLVFVRPIGVGQCIQEILKKLFSIVSKLSIKRFPELLSDWPKLLLGTQALVRGHINLTCVVSNTPTVGQ